MLGSFWFNLPQFWVNKNLNKNIYKVNTPGSLFPCKTGIFNKFSENNTRTTFGGPIGTFWHNSAQTRTCSLNKSKWILKGTQKGNF